MIMIGIMNNTMMVAHPDKPESMSRCMVSFSWF